MATKKTQTPVIAKSAHFRPAKVTVIWPARWLRNSPAIRARFRIPPQQPQIVDETSADAAMQLVRRAIAEITALLDQTPEAVVRTLGTAESATRTGLTPDVRFTPNRGGFLFRPLLG